MKKIFGIVMMTLVLFALVFTFVGCGEDEGDWGDDYSPECVIHYYRLPTDAMPVTLEVYDPSSFTMSIPTRMGYKFLGLYDSPDGGIQIIGPDGKSNISLSDSLILYAQWQAASYIFSFDAGEGYMVGSGTEKSYLYDSNIGTFPVAEREGYTFTGWRSDSGLVSDGAGSPVSGKTVFNLSAYNINPDGKCYFTATWERRELTVTFNYNDGSYISETKKMYYGDTLYLADLPYIDYGNKETYGWVTSPGSSAVIAADITGLKDNLTLYAIWRNYKMVEFVETEDKTELIKVYDGDNYSPYIPKRNGYEFDGWYETKSFSGNPLDAVFYYNAKDKYYARWYLENYTIDFAVDPSLGCVGNTESLSYNVETDTLLPILTRDKYTFVGWCKDENLSDTPLVVIEAGTYGNLTLYPKFKGDDRKVNLDAAGGTIGSSVATLEYGAINTLPVPTIADYAFFGWYLNGETRITGPDGVALSEYLYDGEQNLVAKYAKKYYVTVEIPYSAGTVEIKDYYVEGESVILKFVHNDEGYTYGGFYDGKTLKSETKTYGFIMPTEDVKLRIQLTPGEFELRFNEDGGFKTLDSFKVKYKENYTLPIAYKEGYTFVGWLFDGELVTDATGNSLSPWISTTGATLKASYEEDKSGVVTHYITNLTEFLAMAEDPSGKYVLVSDLDFAGINYVSIPTFSGTLDGNSHSITGLQAPLFDKVTGTVRNLKLEVNITGATPSGNGIGTLANSLEGSGTVSGITVYGNVNLSGVYNVGGIVGVSASGTVIKNCTSYANVILAQGTVEDGSVGGVIGKLGGSIVGSKNFGTIIGQWRVGGIAGCATSSGVLSDCENVGTVKGGKHTGGVIGFIDLYRRNLTLTALVNQGSVSGTSNVGGIIGYIYSSQDYGRSNGYHTVTMSDFDNSGSITGEDYVAGIIGYYYADFSCNSSYSAWCRLEAKNFSNTADISGKSYVGGIFGYAHTDEGNSYLELASSSGMVSADYYVGGVAARLENVILRSSSNRGTSIVARSALINDAAYYAYLGGYVGYGGNIVDCTNYAEINYTQNGMYVGGIAGYVVGDITNCANAAAVYAPASTHVGGIAGYAKYGNRNITFENLSNTAAVTGLDRVGGLFGTVYSYADMGRSSGTYTVQITTVENSGNVTGNDYVAGIAGHFSAKIDVYSSSYTGWSKLVATAPKNSGNITGNSYVGGIFGYASTDNSDSKVTAGSSSGHIKASYYVGGLAGKLSAIQLDGCSNKGTTIEATGYLIDGSNYYAYVGGYVGYGGHIKGAKNETEIIYSEEALYVGGIAGYATGNIIDCSNEAKIYAPKSSYVGGLVGYAGYGAGNITFENLSNTAAVTGFNRVGGLFGTVYSYANIDRSSGTYTVQITTVENSGNITGNDYVAGIAGHFSAKIDVYSSSYTGWSKLVATAPKNSGNITGNSYVGGIFGYASTDNSDSKVTAGSSSGHIKASYYIGGLAGKLSSVQLDGCSNNGTTIEATGYLIDGSNYYAYVGGYVGYGGHIKGAKNETEIIYSEEALYVGGIAGYATGNIIDCSNEAKVYAPNAAYVGGLVGYAGYGNTSITYTNLLNTADVTGRNRVGGLFGTIYSYANIDRNSGTYTVQITTVENSGNITGNDYVAGIAGHFSAKIDVYSSSYTGWSKLVATAPKNSGNITGHSYVGGIFGYASTDTGDSKIVKASSSGHIKASYYVGGIAGQLSSIQLDDSSNKGTTIEATGYLIDGTNYYAYVGGYVGYGGHIKGAKNETEIIYNERGMYVGGIAGYSSGNIVDCSNAATIYAPVATHVGGLVGHAGYGNTSITYTNLLNTANVTGLDRVGGLFGTVRSYANIDRNSGTYTVQITTVENSGNIIGNDYVAGIAGHFSIQIDVYSSSYTGWSKLVATSPKNTGNITGHSYVGGIFGYASTDNGDSTITAASSSGHIKASYYVGGIAARLDSVQLDSCSNEGTTIEATGFLLENSNHYAYVGGYVGRGGHIKGCNNRTDISYSGDGRYVGGVAGYASGSVKDSSNSGRIYAPNAIYVGGIVGGAIYGSTSLNHENLVNSGEVTGGDYTAGIIGYTKGEVDIGRNSAQNTITVKNVENRGTITGKTNVGGIYGYVYFNIKVYSSSYTGWTKMSASIISNSGAICGEDVVGGLIGYFYSDGSSVVVGYNSTGTVTMSKDDGISSPVIAQSTNVTIEQ